MKRAGETPIAALRPSRRYGMADEVHSARFICPTKGTACRAPTEGN